MGAFGEYLAGLSSHDAAVLIAVGSMIEAANADGRIEKHTLVERFRGSYLGYYGEGRVDDTGVIMRLKEVQRMTRDGVEEYLDEDVIGRLQTEGWITTSDDDEPVIAFPKAVWDEILFDRPAFSSAIGTEVRKRFARPDASRAVTSSVDGDSHLRARELVKIYKRRRVVNEVDIELRQGEIVGLLGPNGAGKTTTFYMITGLVPPDAGRVYLDEQDVSAVPMYLRARKGIGYLSQEPSIFRKLTVEENIRAILETLPLEEDQQSARLEALLDELSIKHLRKNKAYSLSGGERRRLEITRALVTQPKFMLLDEPFAGVDPIAVDDIQRIVASLKQRGLGVLITDHNVRETLSITDRAYIMFDGRIHIEGTSEELVNDPEARKLYLGEDFRL